MKKRRLSKILFAACNICLIIVSIIGILYSMTNLILANREARTIFNTLNKDYEACFGKSYEHETSYFTEIACMKMAISSDIITKSANLKNQYLGSIDPEKSENESNTSNNPGISKTNAFDMLKGSLTEMQNYNNAIIYKKSSMPLFGVCESLYTALNYVTYGSDALIKDVVNFIDDQETLSLAADKDTQEIHIMSKMSTEIYLNLNQQIFVYKFIILAGVIFFLGTCVNIYRIKARKNKYRRKIKVQKI